LFAGVLLWQVIVAGSKEVVAKALRQADKYREELLKRGVLLVPLVWTGTNEAPFKKKGFGGSQKPATTPIPIGVSAHLLVIMASPLNLALSSGIQCLFTWHIVCLHNFFKHMTRGNRRVLRLGLVGLPVDAG
jgi:hypothetical protein